MEIERKYLVKYPTLAEVKLMQNLVVKDIVQIYLREIEEGTERRIRKVFTQNNTICYYTEKKKYSELVREENEKVISTCEYLKLVLEAITSLREIKKYRLCFTYENQDLNSIFILDAMKKLFLKLNSKMKQRKLLFLHLYM